MGETVIKVRVSGLSEEEAEELASWLTYEFLHPAPYPPWRLVKDPLVWVDQWYPDKEVD